MKSKDHELIAEAYISAVQKTVDVPTDATVKEQDGSAITTVSIPASPEAMGAMDQATPCGSSGSDSMHEESEEHWMVKSNLFSLYTCAKKIHNLAQMGLDLEPWAQQKIAVASDNLEAVMKYAAYEAAEKGLSS